MDDSVGVTYQGRPKRGRKLKVPGQTRADRKRLSNTNKTHINSKGKVHNEITFNENLGCQCTRNCTGIVPVPERRRLFSQFWSCGNFSGRVGALVACVSAESLKRFKGGISTKRGNEPGYLIYGTPVCKKAIIKTLQINDSRLYKAIEKYLECESLGDLRGLFSGGRNALPEAKKMEVRAHIASFPRYISHYARGKTESKYLSVELNLAKLYKLYCEEADSPVSQSYYEKIFKKNFNLLFKRPKTDTCRECDFLNLKIKSSSGAEREIFLKRHEEHLIRAESLRKQMYADLAMAKILTDFEVITADMQKILNLPNITTSIVYYLRQLNLYNFGIHIGSTGIGIMNVWTEDEASKGTQEVGSCLKAQIEKCKKKNLILWADSCGGQNRSIKLVLMMMHILHNHETLESISLRYLLSGHSF